MRASCSVFPPCAPGRRIGAVFKESARLLALLALAHAASAGADGHNVTMAATRGETNYESDRNWSAVDTNRFMVGYDFGAVPFYVELAYMESGTSTYDFFAYCGCVVAGFPPDNRQVSAWQLAAGYRLWTHQRTGSALSLRAGFHRAESSVYLGNIERYRSNGLAFGAAGTFMVTPAVGVRAEWEWLQGLEDIEKYSASQALVGAVVKFGGYPQ